MSKAQNKKRVRPGDPCLVLVGDRYWVSGTIRDCLYRNEREIAEVLVQFQINSNTGWYYTPRARIFVKWLPFSSPCWKRDTSSFERDNHHRKVAEKLAAQKQCLERESEQCPTSAKTLRQIEAVTLKNQLELQVIQKEQEQEQEQEQQHQQQHQIRSKRNSNSNDTTTQPPWYLVVVQEWLNRSPNNDITCLTAKKPRKHRNKKSKRNTQSKNVASIIWAEPQFSLNRYLVGADDASLCSEPHSEWSELYDEYENDDINPETKSTTTTTKPNQHSTSTSTSTSTKSKSKSKIISEQELISVFQDWESVVSSFPELNQDESDFDNYPSGNTSIPTEDFQAREVARREREIQQLNQESARKEREELRATLAVQLAQFNVGAPTQHWDPFNLASFQSHPIVPTSLETLTASPPVVDITVSTFPPSSSTSTQQSSLEFIIHEHLAAPTPLQQSSTSSSSTLSFNNNNNNNDTDWEEFKAVRKSQVVGDFTPIYFPDSTELSGEFSVLGEIPTDTSSCTDDIQPLRPDSAHPSVVIGIDPLYKPARDCVNFTNTNTLPSSACSMDLIQNLNQLKEAGLIMEEEYQIRLNQLVS